MENIHFTFNHDLKTNFLEINGTKTFNNKNYTCGVWGKIYEINLQEMLHGIEIGIQNKIIEDLNNRDKELIQVIIRNEDWSQVLTRVKGEQWSSEVLYQPNEIHCKFNELEQKINKLECKIDGLISDIINHL